MSILGRLWLVLALIALGSFGWGDAIVRVLDLGRRPGASSPGLCHEVTTPFKISAGIALFLAVGGIAVAGGIAYFPVLSGWLLIGSGLALARLTQRARARHAWRLTWRSGLCAVVGILLGLAASGAALSGPSNPNDDDGAYLYLAQRLLRTGAMIDPFNFRRLTSYGGEELFQALVLKVAGVSAALVVEWCFFALLAVALFVGRLRRPYALPTLAVAGIVIVVARPVGASANVAPTFSGVALTLALIQLLAVPREQHDVRRYVLAGLFVGALLSLRYAFAIPAAVVVLTSAVVMLRPGQALARVGAATAAGVAAISGWAVALERSSGTPIFPLVSGNLNTEMSWRDPKVRTIAQYLERLRGELVTDGWGLEMLATVAILGLLVGLARESASGVDIQATVAVLGGAVGGCAVLLLVATVLLSGGSYTEIGRYDAPSALATVLSAIGFAWKDAEARLRVLAHLPRGTTTGAMRRPVTANATAGVLSMAMLSIVTPAVSGATISDPATRLVRGAASDVVAAGKSAEGGSGFNGRLISDQENRYREISDDIPRGARVLAAVDLPMLLDFSRFSFATLDIVGAASPSPHIPVMKGAGAVIAYLEHLGYSGIVASNTESTGLYNYGAAKVSATSSVWDYQVTAKWTLAWSKVLSELSHDRALHISRVPTLAYYGFPSR